MELEDLLKQAKELYPVGTVFECLHHSTGGPVNNSDEFYVREGDQYIIWESSKGDGIGCVYTPSTCTWATIISKPSIDKVREFKVGDEVYLEKCVGGVYKDGKRESDDMSNKLPLNQKLVIDLVCNLGDYEGCIKLTDYSCWHTPGKFKYWSEHLSQKLISEYYHPSEHKIKITNREEFKIGDWVLLKSGGAGNGLPHNLENVVVQLEELPKSHNHLNGNINPDFKVTYRRSTTGTRSEYIIRHATPEEINKQQSQIFNQLNTNQNEKENSKSTSKESSNKGNSVSKSSSKECSKGTKKQGRSIEICRHPKSISIGVRSKGKAV